MSITILRTLWQTPEPALPRCGTMSTRQRRSAARVQRTTRAVMMATLRWRNWDEEAFELALQRDVPVLLALMSSCSEECRKMEGTTYMDDGVVSAIEASVVPIRVDVLRRPDIKSRYNVGGLPGTAFLTPTGMLLTSATYLDATGMLDAVTKVADYYSRHRPEILTDAAERERQSAAATEPQGLITSGTVTRVERALTSLHDETYGGFKTLPKKLHPEAVQFLILRHFRTSEPGPLDLATKILKEVCSSPLFDLVDGGMFHAASGGDWSGIDYAKYALDNADALRALIMAARVTSDPGFEAMANLVLEWSLETLLSDDDLFFAAQAPDAAYYQLTPEEREPRPALPAVPITIVESAAAMATACLDAAIGLGAKEAGTRALAVAERLWKEAFDAEQGMARAVEPMLADRTFGFFGDQVRMLELLLRAFELGGHPIHQRRAVALAGLMETLFGDPNGGFFDSVPQGQPVGELKFRKKSLLQNGLAAQLFQRVGALTHNDHFREVAAAALRRFSEGLEQHGELAGSIAFGCDVHMRGLTEVMVVGERASRDTARLRLGALETFSPVCVVNLVDPAADSQTLKIRGVEYPGSPVAFVYYGGERLGPIADREELGESVIQLGRA
ncbi:MAG: hypothetical protein DCC49_00685 [Acidobacteria bacterium]|nr:MAG: hypothetical protein DCC49_00685 [Acidobacteriota bacterium]